MENKTIVAIISTIITFVGLVIPFLIREKRESPKNPPIPTELILKINKERAINKINIETELKERIKKYGIGFDNFSIVRTQCIEQDLTYQTYELLGYTTDKKDTIFHFFRYKTKSLDTAMTAVDRKMKIIDLEKIRTIAKE